MADEIKKYCEGLDCAICDEKEPCIYKIANELEQKLANKEQECEELKEKLKNYEIQEDFNKCQKAQNRFVKEQLSGVFNNLRERDIAVIRGMNKTECKNKECEVEK